MSFLDRFRRKCPEKTPQQLAENAQRLSETAVNYAKQCQRDLDYSEKTLPALEALLEDLSQDIPKSHPTESQIWSMALIFGSYLGEVMLRDGLAATGYAWATNGPPADGPGRQLHHPQRQGLQTPDPGPRRQCRLLLPADPGPGALTLPSAESPSSNRRHPPRALARGGCFYGFTYCPWRWAPGK